MSPLLARRVDSVRTQLPDGSVACSSCGTTFGGAAPRTMVAGGAFRSDLYYRLSVFPIFVPPLRERPEDIAPLVQHFTRRFSREIGRDITTIPAATMDALQKWPWPGNIRELENVIERAVILSPGSTLQVPASAIMRRGQLEGVYLFAPDSTLRLRWIRTGRDRDSAVEVLSGLAAGDSIALEDPVAALDRARNPARRR